MQALCNFIWLRETDVGPAHPSLRAHRITSALGRLAPDTLWLADTHMAEGTQAEAAVTRVQGHRAHVSSIEAHGSMLHLLRATAVHLCKRTPAFPECQLAHSAQSLFPHVTREAWLLHHLLKGTGFDFWKLAPQKPIFPFTQ